jgi:hypothetical protein
MNKIFKYSLLKYRPSYVLDEQVNIGILFIFLDDCKVHFSFPKSLARLSALYPDVDLNDTKRYLSAFKARANNLSTKNLFVETISDNLIEKEFLIADANSFFFSEFKTGIYDSVDLTISHFTNQYLAYYGDLIETGRKDDDYLVRKFTEGVRQKDRLLYFKKDVKLSNNIVTANFDIAWQNGTTNYAKALSFDFVKAESIQRKAVQWFGEMVQLDINNNLDNKRFDFWLAEPSNRQLFKSYEKAIAILDSIPQKKRIILEKDFDDYIDEAVETSKPLEHSFFDM